MKDFNGKALFLNRSDINTDEIIPAKYLTESTKEALAPHAMEDLELDGFNPATDVAGKRVIFTRENFGCGSSREHAPWALEMNGIHAVIAESYARIFRQNMFNCGMLAIELPSETIKNIFAQYEGKDVTVSIDVEKESMQIEADGKTEDVTFELSGYDKTLVKTGGWVEYADANY